MLNFLERILYETKEIIYDPSMNTKSHTSFSQKIFYHFLKIFIRLGITYVIPSHHFVICQRA